MFKAQIRRGLRVAIWGFTFSFLIQDWLAARSYEDAPFAEAVWQSGNPNAAQAVNAVDPPAEQVFKNIQALKGMPAAQMKSVMNLIGTSVGMRCEQCHVPDANEKDDKRAKQTTRRMILMTQEINKASFEGQPQITCYSCHRGQQRPIATPPIGQPAAPAPAPGPRPVTAGLPTFDQIIDKYLQAIGSSEAYDKLKSRVMKGSMIDGKGNSFPVEVDQAAPDKMVMITTLPDGVAAQGYNGTIGWTKSPSEQTELKGSDLAQLKRAADMARPLKIKEESLSPRVLGKVKVGDREAYQVSARADGQRVQLFFDAQTGLLLRRLVMRNTVLGAFPEQTDYDDYREVDGVKLAFVTRFSAPDPSSGSTIEWKEITHNVPVDEAKFDPPAVQK
ncbi:MAG: photosynthetic reaction center cytochrome c subunit [Acidobacteriia bacterium]|nr:photosynthetic reaction center cytochrome c subunit [Terriglobia bacterium]